MGIGSISFWAVAFTPASRHVRGGDSVAPAVHEVVLSSHLQSAQVRMPRHRKRPELTGEDPSGHRFITRNESDEEGPPARRTDSGGSSTKEAQACCTSDWISVASGSSGGRPPLTVSAGVRVRARPD